MPNLDTLLSFPSHRAGPSTAAERTPIPPSSSHVLVTDTTDAPALFVLIHFLRAAHAINRRDRSTPPPTSIGSKGKARAYTKVIWLGCNSDGIVHLKNVARKSGIHLEDDARTGAFCHIDAIAHACPPSAHDSLAASAAALNIHQQHQPGARAFLHRLYAKLAQQLTEPSAQTEPDPSNVDDWSSRNIIIIDDLTALAWTLDPSDPLGQAIDLGRELNNWISAITSLAAKNNACVVTLMHADATSCSKIGASDPIDECLFSTQLQKADVWIEVKELGSGRARDCDGEITVHPLVRPSLARALPAPARRAEASDLHGIPPLQAFAIETPCPNRSKAVLYRIAPDGQSAALGGASIGSNTGRVQVWARGTGRGFL